MILAFSFSFSDREKVRFSPTNSLVLSFRAKALSSALQTFLGIKNTGSKFNTFKQTTLQGVDIDRYWSNNFIKLDEELCR